LEEENTTHQNDIMASLETNRELQEYKSEAIEERLKAEEVIEKKTCELANL
jgi:hypothetical protein